MLLSLFPLSVLLSLSYEKDIFDNEDENLSFGRCILVVRQFFNFHYMKENFKNTILSFLLQNKNLKLFKIKMLMNYKKPMKLLFSGPQKNPVITLDLEKY